MYKLWTSKSSSMARVLGLNQIRLITWAIVGAPGKQRKALWRLESGRAALVSKGMQWGWGGGCLCIVGSVGRPQFMPPLLCRNTISFNPQTPSQGHSYYHTTFSLLNYLAQGPIASN